MSKKTSKKTRIVNPRTGSTVFAVLPAIGNPESPHSVSSGNIYLFEGDNWGPAGDFKGYGLAHIIGKHGPELHKDGYVSKDDLIRYVDEILQPGAQVYLEGDRPIVLQTPQGMVVLEQEYSFDEGTYYSVVTAYRRRNPRGKLIGKWQ